MTTQTRTTLKAAFAQGKTPQGSDYVDLIDSDANLVAASAQSFASDIFTPQLITTHVSANTISSTVSVSTGFVLTTNLAVTSACALEGITSAASLFVDDATINVLTLGTPTTAAVSAAASAAGYVKLTISGATAMVPFYT